MRYPATSVLLAVVVMLGGAPVASGAAEGSMAAVSAGTPIGGWQEAGTLNAARSRLGMAFFPPNGRYYVLGGEATGGNRDIPIEEYDPLSNTWTERANLLIGVSNTGAANVGNYIYVPGGVGGPGVTARPEMQRYDPVANEVAYVAPMPTGNHAHAVVAHGNRIHVLGGSPSGAAGTTHRIYDATANTWSDGAPLPTAVQYPAAASDGTYIYVLGGNTTNLTTVQRYNPATNGWDPWTPMLEGRGGPAAFFDGSDIWVVGGGWTTYVPTTESYDPATNTWTPGPPVASGFRTGGVAFGNHLAVKAGGWNGAYMGEAERLLFAFQRPDAQIRRAPPFRGNDVYNSTGAGQMAKSKIKPGRSATFRVKIENDGNVTDSFVVKGSRGSSSLTSVYLKGKQNITKKVVKGKYATAPLAPGSSQIIRLKVTANATGKRTWRITIRSVGDLALLDAVRARLRVT